MKKLIHVLIVLSVIISCEEVDYSSVLDKSASTANSGNSWNYYPLQSLFLVDITQGVYGVANDQGQALALSGGVPVCHSDVPANAVQFVDIRPNAPDGIYLASNGVEIGHFGGSLAIIPESFAYDSAILEYSLQVAECLECPENFRGFVVSLNANSQTGSRILTDEDEEEERKSCAGAHMEVMGRYYQEVDLINFELLCDEELYWETVYGEKIDIFCLFTGYLRCPLNAP